MSAIPKVPGTPRCLFQYYGGKSKIARWYPSPRYPRIIEPFGGSGAYAFMHAERRVRINDARPEIGMIYEFMCRPDSAALVARYVEPHYHEGDVPARMALSRGAPIGLAWWLAIESRSGKYALSLDAVVTKWGAIKSLAHARARFLSVLNRVAHWDFSVVDYEQIPNQEATWFVDPPYSSAAGRIYGMPRLDYGRLAEWVRARRGQVIVCEQFGATWLPFEVLVAARGMQTTTEVVYLGQDTVNHASSAVGLFDQAG